MTTIENLRPVPEPLDPDWSVYTLRAILAEPAGAPSSRRPRGRRIAALAAVAAATAATGVVALHPSPTFALERQADGDLVITVMELSDSDGLERALAKEGITAEVNYEAGAAVSTDLRSAGDPACWPGVGDVVIDPADNGGVAITLAAGYVAAHHGVLHLTAAGGREQGLARYISDLVLNRA